LSTWRAPTLLGLAIAAMAVAIAMIAPARPALDDTPVVARGIIVDASRTRGPLITEFDTQIIYPDVLNHVPDGPSHLSGYAKHVRLMLGTDGAYLPDHPPTLPAGWTKGAWDFRTLDELVTSVYASGAMPVFDIGYMPDWLWDCPSGRPLDPSFAAFGEYAARLVSYYNRGSFVAEDGRVIVNPAGTAHRVDVWEIWNEPDLWTLACVGPTGKGPGLPSLTPATYLAIWNALGPRMREVDPTIQLAGPTTARGAEGNAQAYLELLMRSGSPKPDIITMHAYGSHDERDLDRCVFDGYASGKGCLADGIAAMAKTVAQFQALAEGRTIWITEANSLASYAMDAKARNWGPLGTAWKASVFARMAALNVGAVFEYSFVHPAGKQFSVIDPVTGAPLLSYWTHRELARSFPVGATMLGATSGQAGIDVLAVRLPDGVINVLVVDRIVLDASDAGGAGVATSVQVDLVGLATGGELTVTMLDAQTPLVGGPSTAVTARGDSATVSFGGYGAAILSYRPSAARAR
jgi:hypothetical protein